MTTKIRGWIGKHRGEQLNDTWRYSWDLPVSKEKMYPDDICIELTIVDPSVLEREADEAIKAIDEEMKK